MLILFSITPNALHECNDKRAHIAAHNRCIICWKLNGFLICDDLFEKEIIALPQMISKKWQVALKDLHKRRIIIDKYSNSLKTCSKEDLILFLKKYNSEYFTDIMKLILVGEVEANQYGISSEEQISSLIDSFEFCIFNHSDQSKFIQENNTHKSIPIYKDSLTEEVWKKYFNPFLKFSNNVILVDRYALQNHFKNNKINEYSGIENLFRYINKTKTDKKICITVFSGIPEDHNSDDKYKIEKLSKDFLKYVQGNSISNITFNLLDQKDFRRIVHERWIRFNDFVCNMDKGTELIEGERVKKDQTFDIKIKDDYHEKKEQELLSCKKIQRCIP